MTALATDNDIPAAKIHNRQGTVDQIGFSHEISVSMSPLLLSVRLGS